MAATNAAMDEAVGKIYVERYFPAETKARMQEMVDNIIDRLQQAHRAAGLDGAGHARQGAAKAQDLNVGVGYPDRGRTTPA